MDMQIIHTDGDDMVLLTRRDYDALLARAGDPAAEDRMTRRLGAEAQARIAAGTETKLPGWFAEAVVLGGNPVRALRKHRGLTQSALATAAGITQGYLSEIERGTKMPNGPVLDALSRALDLDPAWLRSIQGNRRIED